MFYWMTALSGYITDKAVFFIYNAFMNLINQIDIFVLNFAEQIRTPFLTAFFKSITYLGEWTVILPIAIIVSAVLILKRRKKQDAILAFISLGSLGFAFLLKNLVHRARPVGGLINETSFSFPSAHAVISVVFYGFIIYLLLPKIKNKKLKALKIFAVSLLILLIGFSRIYLGVHYLSDVLTGYIIGFIWFGIGIYGIKFFDRKKLSA